MYATVARRRMNLARREGWAPARFCTSLADAARVNVLGP